MPRRDAEAIFWYQKAADQGHRNACINLGVMHWNGKGVPKDNVEAYKWFHITQEVLGEWNNKAAATIVTMEKTMTPEQRVEGRKRAREFAEQLEKKRSSP